MRTPEVRGRIFVRLVALLFRAVCARIVPKVFLKSTDVFGLQGGEVEAFGIGATDEFIEVFDGSFLVSGVGFCVVDERMADALDGDSVEEFGAVVGEDVAHGIPSCFGFSGAGTKCSMNVFLSEIGDVADEGKMVAEGGDHGEEGAFAIGSGVDGVELVIAGLCAIFDAFGEVIFGSLVHIVFGWSCG